MSESPETTPLSAEPGGDLASAFFVLTGYHQATSRHYDRDPACPVCGSLATLDAARAAVPAGPENPQAIRNAFRAEIINALHDMNEEPEWIDAVRELLGPDEPLPLLLTDEDRERLHKAGGLTRVV